ncbi:MAG: hypothetical protein ACRYG8_20350, partial [Janthinobacterium lividum]
VSLTANPHHRRAMLVVMTSEGEAGYMAAIARQEGWADTLAVDLGSEDIEAAGALLRELQRRLRDSNATSAAALIRSTVKGA